MKVRRQSLDEARLTLPQRSKQRLMKSFEEKPAIQIDRAHATGRQKLRFRRCVKMVVFRIRGDMLSAGAPVAPRLRSC